MRTALFWDITRRVVVISCRRFGTTYRSLPQGLRIKSKRCSYSVRCTAALHFVFFSCYGAGLRLPPSYFFLFCFRLTFIDLILSFLPTTSLMSVFYCVFLSRFTYTDYHSPLPLTTCNNPIGWQHTTDVFSPPTRFLVYTPFMGYRLSFEFLSPEDGPDKLSRNVGKVLRLLGA